MNIDIDLKNVREFVTSEKFTTFLTSNTTNFGTAAFVLQTVLNELDRAENPSDETCYKVSKTDLLNLLKAAAKLAILEADGVDNWWGYMEGRTECFKEWYEVSEEEACEMSFEDAAKLDIQQYERV